MEAHSATAAAASSSSDDEEDQRHLIEQNERRNNHRSSATFHLEKLRFSAPNFNKRYILAAVILPLLILLLYFATNIHALFSVPDFRRANSESAVLSRMRQSELRALFLLKQQQLGLIKLNNNFDLATPISLNNQIQQALLSSHQFDSVSNNGTGTVDPTANICRKVDQRLSERKTIDWKPDPNKYLFAVCVSGQMSNHLICLEKHMFFAAILNRVLVVPSSKVDYEFHRVLDIDHINKCVGRKVVVTFEEFAESRKNNNHVHVDKFICYFSLPVPCYMDEERVRKIKSSGVSIGGKLESPWTDDVKSPKKRTVQDVVSKFSTKEEVIGIGDVFFADVESDWVMQPGGPIAHSCKALIEPSRLILLTAQRFIQTFLGRDFVALHFRRHGFLKFCNAKQPSCFFPVPQAADCINRVVERANTPVVYLSTDAADSETGLLQSLLFVNGKTVPLVKRPQRNSAEKWDALLYRHGLEGDPQVEAMLDKTICALSTVFIGNPGSTFTDDIRRIRKDWGSLSVCDEDICQGELPNFIAEAE